MHNVLFYTSEINSPPLHQSMKNCEKHSEFATEALQPGVWNHEVIFHKILKTWEGKKNNKSISLKSYTVEVILPLWQPGGGERCGTAVSDTQWRPAVKLEEPVQVRPDQGHSHTVGPSSGWKKKTSLFL